MQSAKTKREVAQVCQATLLAWVEAFREAPAFDALDSSAQSELDGVAHVMAYCFVHRWSRAQFVVYPLSKITADDVVDLATSQFPHQVSAAQPRALVDAFFALVVWAVKSGRIADKAVEYACRDVKRVAYAAMEDPGKWSAGKTIVNSAMKQGVDVSDLAQLRVHGLEMGLLASYVDEFLPPPPVSLGAGRWLWLADRR